MKGALKQDAIMTSYLGYFQRHNLPHKKLCVISNWTTTGASVGGNRMYESDKLKNHLGQPLVAPQEDIMFIS